IRAKRELVAYEFIYALPVHDQHNNVGLLNSDLKSNAAAFNGNEGRRGPGSLGLPAHHDALAIFSAQAEPRLLKTRNDGHAFRLIKEIARNSLVGRSHDFVKDFGCAPEALDFVGSLSG